MILDALAVALVHSVWHGLAVGAVCGVLLSLVPDRSAARHSIAMVGLTGQLVLFLATFAQGSASSEWSTVAQSRMDALDQLRAQQVPVRLPVLPYDPATLDQQVARFEEQAPAYQARCGASAEAHVEAVLAQVGQARRSNDTALLGELQHSMPGFVEAMGPDAACPER